MNPRMQISTLQIANINTIVEGFEVEDGGGSSSLISE